MSAFIKSIAVTAVLAFLMGGASPADAAPKGGWQSDSAFNVADLYFDYKVVAWFSIGGGYYEWGPYDTYQEALTAAFSLMMSGYWEDVEIIWIKERYLLRSP